MLHSTYLGGGGRADVGYHTLVWVSMCRNIEKKVPQPTSDCNYYWPKMKQRIAAGPTIRRVNSAAVDGPNQKDPNTTSPLDGRTDPARASYRLMPYFRRSDVPPRRRYVNPPLAKKQHFY